MCPARGARGNESSRMRLTQKHLRGYDTIDLAQEGSAEDLVIYD